MRTRSLPATQTPFFLALFIASLLGWPDRRLLAQTAPDQFRWSNVPAIVRAGDSFQATVQALDRSGNVLTGFNGSAWIDAQTPGHRPQVLITEVETLAYERVEMMNTSSDPLDVSGWKVLIYETSQWPWPKVTFTLPQGTVCPPQGVFTVRGSGQFPGAWPDFSVGVFLGWGIPIYPYTLVRLLDSEGRPVDTFCALQAFPLWITQPSPVAPAEWFGAPVPINYDSNLSFQRVGKIDTHTAADWKATPSSFGFVNPALTLPVLDEQTHIPLGTVTFVQGVWQGELSIPQADSLVRLSVYDGLGHSGQSSSIQVVALPTLQLALPTTTRESPPGSEQNGTVTLPSPLDRDLTVQLDSTLPQEVKIPATVILPAGQLSITFPVLGQNDTDLDGPRFVTITASASGHQAASGVMTNLDDEIPTLSLTLASAITEGIANLEGIGLRSDCVISLGAPVSQPVFVQLLCDRPDRLMVPDGVLVPAGQSLARFVITAPDNLQLQTEVVAIVTARVPGWTEATASIQVRDDDTPSAQSIWLELPEDVTEAEPARLATMRLWRVQDTDLPIALISLDPTRVRVPAQVIVPAGRTSLAFPIEALEEPFPYPDARVTVTATAPLLNEASASLTVHDNDLHHILINTAPTIAMVGQPFQISVAGRTASDAMVRLPATSLALTALGDAGNVACQPGQVDPLPEGDWVGDITVLTPSRAVRLHVDDGLGHTAVSTPFDVMEGISSGHAVTDVVFDEGQNVLLLATRSGPGPDSRAIVGLNPETGAVLRRLPLEQEPRTLALSEDGRFLYAGLASTGGVIRVLLPEWTVDQRFPLHNMDPNAGPAQIEVAPGDPFSVIARATRGYPAQASLYRDGVPVSTRFPLPDEYSVGPLAFFGDPHRFFVTQGFGSFGWTHALELTPNGVSAVRSFPQAPGNLTGARDLLFASEGGVFDATGFRSLGVYSGRGLPAPDLAAGFVSFVDGARLRVFELSTFVEVGDLDLPVHPALPTHLVRCGARRLALGTATNQFLIFNTELIPQPSAADLSIAQATPTAPVRVGSEFSCQLTVSNAGPEPVLQALLIDVLPAGTSLVSASSTQGTSSETNGFFTARLGALPVGDSATVTLVLRPSVPGPFQNRAWVTRDGVNPSNSTIRWNGTAILDPTSPPVVVHPLNALALAFDPLRNQLWTSSTRHDGRLETVLRAIDLSTGQISAEVPLEYPATHLALSASRTYLFGTYVNNTETNTNYLTRVHLDSNLRDLTVPIVDPSGQPYEVTDIAGLPGFQDTVVVGRSGPQNDIALYENGITTLQSARDTGPGILTINPGIPGRIYRVGGEDQGGEVVRLQAESGAIRELGRARVLALPAGPGNPRTTDARFAGGRLFSDTGVVADAETLTPLATLPVTGRVEVDSDSGVVVYLHQGPTHWVLSAFKLQELTPAWAIQVPGVDGIPGRLIGCGPGRFAFATSEDQVFVLDTARMDPRLEADLSVTQTTSVSIGTTNVPATFRTTMTNEGPAIAWNVRLSQRFSTGTRVLAASTSRGTLTQENNEWVLHLAALPYGASVSLEFDATMDQPGTLTSQVSAAQDIPDPSNGNNTHSIAVTFRPRPSADLSMQARMMAPADAVTNLAQIRVTVTNSGPDTATGVEWTGNLLPGALLVSATPSQGNATLTDQSIWVPLGSIEAGRTATIDLAVAPTNGLLFQCQVILASALPDPTPEDFAPLFVFNTLATNREPLVDEFPLQATDIAYEPNRRLLIASSTSTTGPYAHSVVALDVDSLKVRFVVPVGVPLNLVALSDNGRYAYGAIASTGGVLRVDLETRQMDLRFPLNPPEEPQAVFRAIDMAVRPGSPETLVVTRRGGAEFKTAIALFRDGIALPQVVNGLPPSESYFYLGFLNADRLATTSPRGFQTMAVNANGLAREEPLISGLKDDFVVDRDRVFLFSGQVLDPTLGQVVANLPVTGPIATEPDRNQVLCLTGRDYGGSRHLRLRCYESTLFQEKWSIPFHWFLGHEKQLVRLGDDGFALLADFNGRLLRVRSQQITQPATDLSVSQSVSPTWTVVDGVIQWRVVVRNQGPWSATGVTLVQTLPLGFQLQSATTSVGTWAQTLDTLTVNLGTLTNDAVATFTVNARATIPGIATNFATVRANESELNPADNISLSSLRVDLPAVLSVGDVMVLESQSNGDVSIPVKLSVLSPYITTARYRTRDGTALAGVDYTAATGTVTLSPGVTNWAIYLRAIRNNSRADSNRSFFLEIFNPANASLGRAVATVTIVDDDFLRISVTPVTIREGDAGTTDARLQVRLSEPSAVPVWVDYLTSPGTAAAGMDFLDRQGSLVFAPGITNLTLGIPVVGDLRVERNESFYLILAAPQGAVLATNQVSVSITNNDPTLDLAVQAMTRGDGLALRYPTIEGRTYRVDFSPKLSPATWTPVAGLIPGTGEFVDTMVVPGSTQGFYRVVLLP